MDYGRPDRADRLAAAYALGELRGPARRRFEALLPAHAALRSALRDWNDRLMPLTAAVAPEAPSAAVWPRIEARLGSRPTAAEAAEPRLWWRRIGVWRLTSALVGGAALGLALLLGAPGPVQPPIVVVLASATPPATGGVAPASFVASISGDGRALVTTPLQNVALQQDRAFELWSLPAGGGAPRSLGLISPSGTTVVERERLVAGAEALAVTLEPAGGGPGGKPSGPVVFVGKLPR